MRITKHKILMERVSLVSFKVKPYENLLIFFSVQSFQFFYAGPSTPNDARSKGAIPKQPAKNTPQVAKQMTYNEASKLNKDSQGKDKNESARASENIKESEEMAAVVNKEQLQSTFICAFISTR